MMGPNQIGFDMIRVTAGSGRSGSNMADLKVRAALSSIEVVKEPDFNLYLI